MNKRYRNRALLFAGILLVVATVAFGPIILRKSRYFSKVSECERHLSKLHFAVSGYLGEYGEYPPSCREIASTKEMPLCPVWTHPWSAKRGVSSIARLPMESGFIYLGYGTYYEFPTDSPLFVIRPADDGRPELAVFGDGRIVKYEGWTEIKAFIEASKERRSASSKTATPSPN